MRSSLIPQLSQRLGLEIDKFIIQTKLPNAKCNFKQKILRKKLEKWEAKLGNKIQRKKYEQLKGKKIGTEFQEQNMKKKITYKSRKYERMKLWKC